MYMYKCVYIHFDVCDHTSKVAVCALQADTYICMRSSGRHIHLYIYSYMNIYICILICGYICIQLQCALFRQTYMYIHEYMLVYGNKKHMYLYEYTYMHIDMCVHIQIFAVCDLRAGIRKSSESTGCLALQYAMQNVCIHTNMYILICVYIFIQLRCATIFGQTSESLQKVLGVLCYNTPGKINQYMYEYIYYIY